ncbi:MAG: TetR/AcrR family transcriptional regulator [Minwuia sp.]|nr:TetR/AcrR family transcriptional regulator [Minwuia sp.]
MDTREHLLLTAEKLLGERGINGVSLREITRVAGQRNASALHYHFGSRDGLIEAIFDKRMRLIDEERMRLIADMEADGRMSHVRGVAEAVAMPVAAFLWRKDGSANYIRFLTEVFLSPDINIDDFVRGRYDNGLRKVYGILQGLLPDVPEQVVRQRFVMMTRAGTFALADIDTHRARTEAAGRPFDLERAIETLIDMWVGGITAPQSERATDKSGRVAA